MLLFVFIFICKIGKNPIDSSLARATAVTATLYIHHPNSQPIRDPRHDRNERLEDDVVLLFGVGHDIGHLVSS